MNITKATIAKNIRINTKLNNNDSKAFINLFLVLLRKMLLQKMLRSLSLVLLKLT